MESYCKMYTNILIDTNKKNLVSYYIIIIEYIRDYLISIINFATNIDTRIRSYYGTQCSCFPQAISSKQRFQLAKLISELLLMSALLFVGETNFRGVLGRGGKVSKQAPLIVSRRRFGVFVHVNGHAASSACNMTRCSSNTPLMNFSFDNRAHFFNRTLYFHITSCYNISIISLHDLNVYIFNLSTYVILKTILIICECHLQSVLLVFALINLLKFLYSLPELWLCCRSLTAVVVVRMCQTEFRSSCGKHLSSKNQYCV